MQKTVTPSLARSMISETDGHAMVVTSRVALWGVSRKLTIRGGVSISYTPCMVLYILYASI